MCCNQFLNICLLVFFVACPLHRLLKKPPAAVGVGAMTCGRGTFLVAMSLGVSLFLWMGRIAMDLCERFDVLGSASVETARIVAPFVTSLLVLVLVIFASRIGKLFASDRPRNGNSPLGMIVSVIYNFGITVPMVMLFAAIWMQFLSKFAPHVPLDKQDIVTVLLATDDVFLRTLSIIQATILAPIAEEIIFRGFAYRALKNQSTGPVSSVATSFLFACLHRHVASFLPLFALSMCLIKIYERNGDIREAMAVHSLFNLLNIIYIFNFLPCGALR